MAKKKTEKTEKTEKTFILMGDILHAGRVAVQASSLKEALDKADDGDFEVFDETEKQLGFSWNGDKSSVEVG